MSEHHPLDPAGDPGDHAHLPSPEMAATQQLHTAVEELMARDDGTVQHVVDGYPTRVTHIAVSPEGQDSGSGTPAQLEEYRIRAVDRPGGVTEYSMFESLTSSESRPHHARPVRGVEWTSALDKPAENKIYGGRSSDKAPATTADDITAYHDKVAAGKAFNPETHILVARKAGEKIVRRGLVQRLGDSAMAYRRIIQ